MKSKIVFFFFTSVLINQNVASHKTEVHPYDIEAIEELSQKTKDQIVIAKHVVGNVTEISHSLEKLVGHIDQLTEEIKGGHVRHGFPTDVLQELQQNIVFGTQVAELQQYMLQECKLLIELAENTKPKIADLEKE